MSFYRERFGHREGEFPVCEDVAARSLALPFFPEMTDGQVERVATALRAVLGARLDSPPHVALRRAAGPGLRVHQPLARRRPAAVAVRRRAVARARAMLAARGIIADADRDALLAGLDARRGGAARRRRSRSARTTRTSTWRSSAA